MRMNYDRVSVDNSLGRNAVNRGFSVRTLRIYISVHGITCLTCSNTCGFTRWQHGVRGSDNTRIISRYGCPRCGSSSSKPRKASQIKKDMGCSFRSSRCSHIAPISSAGGTIIAPSQTLQGRVPMMSFEPPENSLSGTRMRYQHTAGLDICACKATNVY